MNITHATILLGRGPDEVLLHTNLPSSMPGLTQEKAVLNLKCAAETAVQYVGIHFPGIPVEIIKV